MIEEKQNNGMPPMEAWGVISSNMLELYKMRKTANFKGYVDAEIEAEVICFCALRAAEKSIVEGRSKQSAGRWIEQQDGTHYCSECGHDATYTFDRTEICGVACPFCGAKMDGE